MSAALAEQSVMWDSDDYWMECIRRSKSNSAVSGWLDLVEFVKAGTADDRTLSGMHVALRALSQEVGRQLSEKRETARIKRYGR